MSYMVELGRVADFINGAAFKPEDWGDIGLKIIRIQNLTDSTKAFNRTTRKVDDKLHIKKGDLLVSWSATLGVYTWQDDEVGLLNQHIFRVLPNSDIDKNYLRHALVGALNEMNKHLHGATMKHVNRGEFLATKIFLPPISEQKRIAAILDKADEIRRKREQAITKLEQLAQSIFVEMFGDLVINNKAWEFITISKALKLGAITGLQDGNHGESHPKSSDFVENGTPFIMANCLINGKIDYTKAYKLDNSWLKKLRIGFAKPNDVLISHKGTVGEVAIVSVEYQTIILSPQTTYYRTSDKLNSTFLAGYFKNNWFQSILKKEAIQSTRAYIGITRQKDLPFFLPPIALQEEFAKRIKQIEKLKADNTMALANHNALFASLQQQAFSGNL
jgi:type I restriction enzyme S subunit